MNNCPKCGKMMSVVGNCYHCGYRKGDPLTEEEKTIFEEQRKKEDEDGGKILKIILLILIVFGVIYLMTSTLTINITGTITVK